MEHDISVEAFHPEAVSEATPLDHRFTRSPFPTLHVCYHGLRSGKDTAHHPLAAAAGRKRGPARARGGSSSSSSRSDAQERKREDQDQDQEEEEEGQ